MADVWNLVVEESGWAPCFSRPFNDLEVESVKRFLLKLQDKRVYRNEEDMVVWKESKNSKFSVKSFSFALEPSDPLLFLWSII